MKYDATEIYGAGEDCIGSLEIAISEIEGIEEYEDIVKILEEAKDQIESVKEKYIEEANEIWNAERDALNREYERSV